MFMGENLKYEYLKITGTSKIDGFSSITGASISRDLLVPKPELSDISDRSFFTRVTETFKKDIQEKQKIFQLEKDKI